MPGVLDSLLDARLSEAFAPPETPQQSMAIGAKQTAQAQGELRAWNASKHPRGRGGKFGYTTGGKRARHPRGAKTRGQVLQPGVRGALVGSIQRQLGIPADGVYGAQTRAAVTRFQANHGLLVDGKVGRQTLAALRGNTGAAHIPPGPIQRKQALVQGPRVARVKSSTGKAVIPAKAGVPVAHIAGGTVL